MLVTMIIILNDHSHLSAAASSTLTYFGNLFQKITPGRKLGATPRFFSKCSYNQFPMPTLSTSCCRGLMMVLAAGHSGSSSHWQPEGHWAVLAGSLPALMPASAPRQPDRPGLQQPMLCKVSFQLVGAH